MRKVCLAIDIGGGSGRVIAGYPADGDMVLDVVHRFPNRQVRMGRRLYWDFPALLQEMKDGIRKAAEKGYRILSIGIDTWGVDFGLIDSNGQLLGNPVCYRDSRTEGMPEHFFRKVDAAAHYAETGTQVMPINTLFQLCAMQQQQDPQLKVADRLLFMPDLFSFFLTGVANNEYTIASTSELLDAKKRDWNFRLIHELEFPERLFGGIVMPGTSRGCLTAAVKEELGLDYDVEVIAVASHDTASAIYAMEEAPAGSGRAFLSSGTWSLLGMVCDDPILTESARLAGFTNEGGVDGKICLLQNITGLWFLQRLVDQWKARGEAQTYPELLAAAEQSVCLAVVNVDDARFLNPADMELAIADYCREHHQSVPTTKGDFVRCVVQSLAVRYQRGIEELNLLLHEPVRELYIMGGGCQNELLNRLTAQLTGLAVKIGPVEATAIGNLKVQWRAHALL